ncbi:hypothetical protein NYV33_25525 [Escherichia coli]|nr:hypothetical protein [Escherichia coli]
MTTVYSKNGICFLILQRQTTVVMVRSGAIVIIQNIISDLFPNLALACVTIRRPILFSDCGKRQVLSPQRFNHISRVLEVTVLIPENTACATHSASIDTTFISNRQDKNKTVN